MQKLFPAEKDVPILPADQQVHITVKHFKQKLRRPCAGDCGADTAAAEQFHILIKRFRKFAVRGQKSSVQVKKPSLTMI